MIDTKKSENPAATGFNANKIKRYAVDSKAIESKMIATLIAKFALAGHAVIKIDSGFIVTRWGMTYYCNDSEALKKFAIKLGVLRNDTH